MNTFLVRNINFNGIRTRIKRTSYKVEVEEAFPFVANPSVDTGDGVLKKLFFAKECKLSLSAPNDWNLTTNAEMKDSVRTNV